MIHIRIDECESNDKREFQCGIGPDLPVGDLFYFAGEPGEWLSDCPGCNPGGPRQIGTPISKLSGTIGMPGYAEFCEIARSWGYE
jgi:hypothetical protein